MLALGRAIGETAALLLTAGSGLGMPISPLDSGRSMSVHLYILATEGVSEERAYTTALVLMLAVLAVNTAANIVLRRWRKA
jgi:phosphate transport system permease protein